MRYEAPRTGRKLPCPKFAGGAKSYKHSVLFTSLSTYQMPTNPRRLWRPHNVTNYSGSTTWVSYKNLKSSEEATRSDDRPGGQQYEQRSIDYLCILPANAAADTNILLVPHDVPLPVLWECTMTAVGVLAGTASCVTALSPPEKVIAGTYDDTRHHKVA